MQTSMTWGDAAIVFVLGIAGALAATWLWRAFPSSVTWAREAWARRSASTRRRRASELEGDLLQLRKVFSDPVLLTGHCGKRIGAVITYAAVMIMTFVLSVTAALTSELREIAQKVGVDAFTSDGNSAEVLKRFGLKLDPHLDLIFSGTALVIGTYAMLRMSLAYKSVLEAATPERTINELEKRIAKLKQDS